LAVRGKEEETMKLSWLAPALLVGGGAAVVSDKVLVNGKVILKSKLAGVG
jgi:hypothetical protein